MSSKVKSFLFFWAFLGFCFLCGSFFESPLFLKNSFGKLEDLFLKPSFEGKFFDFSHIFLNKESVKAPFLVKVPENEELLGTLSLSQQKQIREYIVKKGDSLFSIAKRFGISPQTIIFANNLKSNLIKIGQKLIILPTDGLIHYVKKGETLFEIAKLYQVNLEKIVDYNDLENEGKIYPGDILIIPGAKFPKKRVFLGEKLTLPKNFFICPISPPCRVTQGLHWYNAVDLSHGKCGEPVFAAASGIVQKIGKNKIAGNFIRILHPLGIVTFYGHLEKIVVSEGEKVSQGQIIGYLGHTGYTIPSGPRGCHLHFETRGARNPFAF